MIYTAAPIGILAKFELAPAVPEVLSRSYYRLLTDGSGVSGRIFIDWGDQPLFEYHGHGPLYVHIYRTSVPSG